MIKTIFFDAAGTLFHLPNGVGWHYRDVAQRFDCLLDEKQLSLAFRTAWDKMPTRAPTRQARPDDDKSWWKALVNSVLDQCSVSHRQLDRRTYFEALYTEFTLPGIWALFPEVRDVLTALRSNFRLGVISNFDRRLRPILSNLDLADFFDPVVTSSEVGADKPDAWIFQRAVDLAGTTAGQSLHVGDDPVCDWAGATSAGLQSFHLHRPANSLRDLAHMCLEPGKSKTSGKAGGLGM